MTKRQYLKPFLIYLLISLVMFWQVTLNLFSYVVNGSGDVYQTLFNLWWVPYSIFTLHQSPYFTHLLFYPIGASLVTQTLTPLAGLFTMPIQFLGMAFGVGAYFSTALAKLAYKKDSQGILRALTSGYVISGSISLLLTLFGIGISGYLASLYTHITISPLILVVAAGSIIFKGSIGMRAKCIILL